MGRKPSKLELNRYNLNNEIKKFCLENKVDILYMESKPVHRDFIGKIFDSKKETIYFKLSGEVKKLEVLQNIFKKLS